MMSVFGPKFYSGSNPTANGVAEYRAALQSAIATSDDPEAMLKEEAIAITTTITEGVRYVIRKDRHVRKFVLGTGDLPLASWAAAVDHTSKMSLTGLKKKIQEMERELERGKIGGFPATMLLYGQPTFTTFAD